MERDVELEGLFETKEHAILEYEKDNFNRWVIRIGEKMSVIEFFWEVNEGKLQKYLNIDESDIPINNFKVGEMSEDIKNMPLWTQIQSQYLPDSVHVSELVRKNLISPRLQEKSYFVLTGISRIKSRDI
jgi:hypothetical protein